MVRSAYTPRTNDDDFSQPGILVRDVFNDAQRTKLVDQVAGSLLSGVREPVLSKAFAYWKNIDADAGRRIEEKVRAGAARSEEHTSELQSLMRISYAVFCLKKKKKSKTHKHNLNIE